jgi:hypothetical protein
VAGNVKVKLLVNVKNVKVNVMLNTMVKVTVNMKVNVKVKIKVKAYMNIGDSYSSKGEGR